MLKYTLRVTFSVWEIVGGVVRHCDIVTKIKIAEFFSWRVSDSPKFILTKISPYMVSLVVILSCSMTPPKGGDLVTFN